MKTLLLVDGSSYLYRAFHALPDLRNRNGEPTGAVYGVLNMLRRLRKETAADYIACVFDAKGKTFRDDVYPQYKANRPPMPDDLAAQLEPLQACIRAMGWPLLAVEGVEADDVIGTLARQASRKGMRTVISTGDKDLAQLLDGSVTLVNTMSNETLDAKGVETKFGVRPEQMIDFLTLVGDSVDNVPGVEKVGPKTAAKWLAQYGSLEEIVRHADEIGGAAGENLRKAISWLPTARQLLTIKTDVDLPFEVEQLQPQPPDVKRLAELFERLDFRSWLRELKERSPGVESAAPDATPASPPAAPPRDYRTVLTEQDLEDWAQRVERAALVSIDTETTSLDPMAAELVGISLCTEPGCAAYIPMGHRYAGAPQQLSVETVLRRLGPWLESAARAKLGQNLKYDMHVLMNHGIRVTGVQHDTLLQSYVLEAHRPHDMDALAERHLGIKTITYDEVTGKGTSRIGFEQVDIARATQYSGEDADVTLRLHQAMYPQLARDERLSYVYHEIEMPVLDVLFVMERNGVLLDVAALEGQSRELGQRIAELERRVHELAGRRFNLGSPKQLQEILFEAHQLPILKKTPTGQPSTDEDVLEQLALDHPLPKLILEHRALSKLKSTYTDKLPKMVNPRTGRVHTTYGQAVAVTGRLASNEPNLQNIPARTPEGRRIREAFIADRGWMIVSADYSQIELRIMAHLSQDPNLLKAFSRGEDVHRHTASEIFGVATDAVTPEQRRYAKVINFGLIYGMSAFGLAAQLGIERAAAQQYMDRYFSRYPGVADYMQRTRESARTRGYVETVFGRRLYLNDIRASNNARRQAAERAAINAPMQGTAADLIKLAMIAVQRWITAEHLATRLIMQVHDELVFEAPEAELGRISQCVPELMSGVAKLAVPLVVDIGAGPNWDRAH
ncbi:MAG TPA: DNA polymerase I [Burkholderiales bacterium]|jgi:DNA polymerase-1|nr:DNA polymerase I [Burkholderiales bacterium]